MDITQLNLIKDIKLVETKVSIKESNVQETSKFQKCLDKSKEEVKGKKVDKNDSKDIKEENIKENSTEDLEKTISKIENILEKKDEALDRDELLEEVSEVVLLLLNNIESLQNEVANERLSTSLENINLDDISKFIKENLMINSDDIDRNKVLLQMNDIEDSLKEILNTINYNDIKENALESRVNINLMTNFTDEDSLNETLINQVNELIKDVFDKNIFENVNSKDDKNLDIKTLIGYLKNNFTNENLKTDDKLINLDNVINLDNLEISKKCEKQNFNDFGNSKDNNEFENSNRDVELLKEEDFLSKILNDDTSSTKVNNYYDRIFNNKLQSNLEVVNNPVNINKETMNTDIIKNIKYMIMDSIEELTVKIYPKELGEVTIKILSEEGIMKAEIKATSKETYNLINSNIGDIKKNLENQGIKIQEVNIGIYNEDTTFFSGKENRDHNERSFNNDDVKSSYIYEEEEVIEEIHLNNNVNYLA